MLELCLLMIWSVAPFVVLAPFALLVVVVVCLFVWVGLICVACQVAPPGVLEPWSVGIEALSTLNVIGAGLAL